MSFSADFPEPENYVAKLIAALDHEEPMTRVRAAWILGQRQEALAIPALIAAAQQGEDPDLLATVADALGKIGDPAGLSTLIRLARSSYLKARVAAVSALAAFDGPQVRETLEKRDSGCERRRAQGSGASAGAHPTPQRKALRSREVVEGQPATTGGAGGSMATRFRAAIPFLSLVLVGFLGRLGYEMIRSPISSLYARDLGAPVEIIGLIVASATISGIFVKFPSGALSDILGFKRLIVAGSVVKAVGPFLYLLVRTWQWLIPVRLFHGLCTAIYAPAASALVASMYPNQRAQRLGFYSSAENAGIVLGPALGGFVLFYSDYNTAFLVSAVIGIAALLVAFSVPVDVPEVKPGDLKELLARLRRGIREIVTSPPILAASAVEATMFFGFGTLQAYLPLYGVSIGLNTAEIGLLFAAQGVTSIFGRPTIGTLSDRIGRKPVIVCGMLADAATVALIPHFDSFPILLIISALFGLGTAAVTPSTTALIADLVKAGQYGSAMGVFGSIWDIGHASGPIISGFLVAAFGFGFAFSTVGVVMVVAILVFLIVLARGGAVEV